MLFFILYFNWILQWIPINCILTAQPEEEEEGRGGEGDRESSDLL